MDYYALGGRGRLRIRERHLRDHVAPLLNASAAGVVKVDLALRSLASLSDEAGLVSDDVSYDALHDLCRPRRFYGQATKLKREWVGDKIERLVRLDLVSREARPGRRPRLVVLRDDGSKLPFDDPGTTKTDPYVSFFGDAFRYERVAEWGSPEIASFFAAMVAERYARSDPQLDWVNAGKPLGSGVWFRSLDWFDDAAGYRPDSHIRIPFSTRTLRRGFAALRAEGLVASKRVHEDPRTGTRFKTPQGRYIYLNGFDDMRPSAPMRPNWTVLLRRPSEGDPAKDLDWASVLFPDT